MLADDDEKKKITDEDITDFFRQLEEEEKKPKSSPPVTNMPKKTKKDSAKKHPMQEFFEAIQDSGANIFFVPPGEATYFTVGDDNSFNQISEEEAYGGSRNMSNIDKFEEEEEKDETDICYSENMTPEEFISAVKKAFGTSTYSLDTRLKDIKVNGNNITLYTAEWGDRLLRNGDHVIVSSRSGFFEYIRADWYQFYFPMAQNLLCCKYKNEDGTEGVCINTRVDWEVYKGRLADHYPDWVWDIISPVLKEIRYGEEIESCFSSYDMEEKNEVSVEEALKKFMALGIEYSVEMEEAFFGEFMEEDEDYEEDED